MHVIFDLDGTLVDTEDLVFDAYKAVGVDYPPQAWGRSWTEWLPDYAGSDHAAEIIHEAKTVAYAAMIQDGRLKTLPSLSLLKALLDYPSRYRVGILTGASTDATRVILRELGLGMHPRLDVTTGKSLDGKIHHLKFYDEHGGVYIDDDQEMIERVIGETNWIAVEVFRTTKLEAIISTFTDAMGGVQSFTRSS